MKSKIIIFGMCALLSACGLGKRGGEIPVDENTQESLILSNLKLNGYTKIQQTKAGNQLQYLGSFDGSALPGAIKGLPTESEIGTLSVEFEDELYANQYEAEVRSAFRSRHQEIKTTVFIVKDNGSPDIVSFAIKSDELARQVSVRLDPIEVKSAPREYCSRVVIHAHNFENVVFFNEQEASCTANGVCSVLMNLQLPNDKGDRWGNYPLNDPRFNFHTCTGKQINYDVTESRINRSIPKVASVFINLGISKHLKNIRFDL